MVWTLLQLDLECKCEACEMFNSYLKKHVADLNILAPTRHVIAVAPMLECSSANTKLVAPLRLTALAKTHAKLGFLSLNQKQVQGANVTTALVPCTSQYKLASCRLLLA